MKCIINKTSKKLIIGIFIVSLIFVCLNNVSAADTGNITANITINDSNSADEFDVNITDIDDNKSVADSQDTNSSALYNLIDVPVGERNVKIDLNSTIKLLEGKDTLVFNLTDASNNPINSGVTFYLNDSVHEALYDEFNKLWFINGLNPGNYSVKISINRTIDVVANKNNELNLTLIMSQIKTINGTNITISYIPPAKNGDVTLVYVKVTDEEGNPVEGISITISINGATGFSVVTTNSSGEAILNYNHGDGKYYEWYNKPGVYPIEVITYGSFINGVYYTANSVNGSIILINNYTPKIEVISKSSPIDLYGRSTVKVRLLEYYPTKKANGEIVWDWHPISGTYLLIWLTGTTGTMSTTDANGYATYYFDPAKTGWTITTVSYGGYTYGNVTIIESVSKEIGIDVTKRADLLITNVKKISSTKYKITVKNNGEIASSKTKLKISFTRKGHTYNKYVTINSLAKGHSTTVTVTLSSKSKNYKKYAVVNYNHKTLEYDYDYVNKLGANYTSKYNYYNNKVSFKSSDYDRYKVDLAVTGLTFNKKTNKYTINVKNIGNKIATGKLSILFWYGTSKKAKSPIQLTVTLKKLANQDTRIQPGSTLNLDGLTYPDKASKKTILKVLKSKYKKYVYINYNKKIKEYNFKNNIKGFKKSQIKIVS